MAGAVFKKSPHKSHGLFGSLEPLRRRRAQDEQDEDNNGGNADDSQALTAF